MISITLCQVNPPSAILSLRRVSAVLRQAMPRSVLRHRHVTGIISQFARASAVLTSSVPSFSGLQLETEPFVLLLEDGGLLMLETP